MKINLFFVAFVVAVVVINLPLFTAQTNREYYGANNEVLRADETRVQSLLFKLTGIGENDVWFTNYQIIPQKNIGFIYLEKPKRNNFSVSQTPSLPPSRTEPINADTGSPMVIFAEGCGRMILADHVRDSVEILAQAFKTSQSEWIACHPAYDYQMWRVLKTLQSPNTSEIFLQGMIVGGIIIGAVLLLAARWLKRIKNKVGVAYIE